MRYQKTATDDDSVRDMAVRPAHLVVWLALCLLAQMYATEVFLIVPMTWARQSLCNL